MIPILQSTRSSKLTISLLSLTSGRTGLIKISSLTLKSVMVRKYALSAAGQNAIFRTAVPAPAVMPRSLSFIKIMVPKDSFSAKSAAQGPHPMKAASPL